MSIKRIVNIAKNFTEADKWDVLQQLKLSPYDRQKIAKKLKTRYYGKTTKDLKEFYNKSA